MGEEIRKIVWPRVIDFLFFWTIGVSTNLSSSKEENGSTEIAQNKEKWIPCEALIRIGCKELSRMPLMLARALPDMNSQEAKS